MMESTKFESAIEPQGRQGNSALKVWTAVLARADEVIE